MSLLTGLVSYWKCDEASGNLLDAHGSNHLTDNNTIGSGTGKVNGARTFNGTDEYASIANNASLQVANEDFTIAAWVYLNTITPGVTAAFVDKMNDSAIAGSYLLCLRGASGKYEFVVGDGSAVGAASASSVTPATSTWTLLIGWHDSVANTINIQVNDGTVFSTAWSTGVTGTPPLNIMRRQTTVPSFTHADPDEIGFWRRVLTPDERTRLHNDGRGLTYPFGNPWYYYAQS